MTILSIDAHRLFSEGLRLMLSEFDYGFEQVSSFTAALDVDPDRIDLVLLDIHLPGSKGQEVIETLRKHFSDAIIVIVSGDENPGTIRKSIAAGAAGYIPKSSSPQVLLAALKLVLAGGTYLPADVLDGVLDGASYRQESQDRRSLLRKSVDALSERQKMVLSRAVQGKPNKVIAGELNIAEGTVKAHLSAAYKALGAANRTEAFYIANKHELHLLERR